MPERTEVEKYVRWMIASRPYFTELLVALEIRDLEDLTKQRNLSPELLRSKEELGNRVEARIEELEEEMKARTINEGIKVFSKKYPQYGKELREIIEEKRMERIIISSTD